ncbi:MAG: G5P family DNA-binding protein [Proteobacteria bacterium]|nr:G5P family DNA-binding protein [Pseudomonadota bacterium]
MKHISVHIDSPAVTRQVTARSDGKVYHLREQSGLFSYPDGQVVRHGITLENDQAEYPQGRYVVDLAGSMYPGKYGPQLSRQLALHPAQPQAQAKTA